MPENSKPAFYEPFPHAHDQISCIEKDPLVFSKSQIFFFFSLEMKVNFRGFEQLRSFSTGGQLHQLNHRITPIHDVQESTCQIDLFVMSEVEYMLET